MSLLIRLTSLYKNALSISNKSNHMFPIPKTSLISNSDVNRYLKHLENYIKNPELYYLVDNNKNTTNYMKFNVKKNTPPNIRDFVKLCSEKD